MKRYPLHGRMILELVPALFIFIAQGTQTVRGGDRSRKSVGYVVVLVLLFVYPCLTVLHNSISIPIREFNPHGDLRKNLFIS